MEVIEFQFTEVTLRVALLHTPLKVTKYTAATQHVAHQLSRLMATEFTMVIPPMELLHTPSMETECIAATQLAERRHTP